MLGLLHFATLADSSVTDNPRFLRHGLKKLKAAQQKLSRCKQGSHRRARAKTVVARQQRKVRNQRSDFLHQASRQLVKQYGVLVMKEKSVPNMVKNHHLALSISDTGWGQFQQYVSYKAAWAGGRVVLVNPRNTSQLCSGCGHIKQKELAARWRSCECGAELDRDPGYPLGGGNQHPAGGMRPTVASGSRSCAAQARCSTSHDKSYYQEAHELCRAAVPTVNTARFSLVLKSVRDVAQYTGYQPGYFNWKSRSLKLCYNRQGKPLTPDCGLRRQATRRLPDVSEL